MRKEPMSQEEFGRLIERHSAVHAAEKAVEIASERLKKARGALGEAQAALMGCLDAMTEELPLFDAKPKEDASEDSETSFDGLPAWATEHDPDWRQRPVGDLFPRGVPRWAEAANMLVLKDVEEYLSDPCAIEAALADVEDAYENESAEYACDFLEEMRLRERDAKREKVDEALNGEEMNSPETDWTDVETCSEPTTVEPKKKTKKTKAKA